MGEASRPPSGLVAWAERRWNLKEPQLKALGQLAVLLALGLILLIGASSFGRPPDDRPSGPATAVDGPAPAAADQLRALARTMASDLERLLSQVAGAGRVVVSVELESGNESVVAVNATSANRTVEERDPGGASRTTSELTSQQQLATSGGSGQPLVLASRAPRIRGVLVVAQGASDPRIRLQLWTAVRTALGVPGSRIQVLPAGGD